MRGDDGRKGRVPQGPGPFLLPPATAPPEAAKAAKAARAPRPAPAPLPLLGVCPHPPAVMLTITKA